VKFSSASKDRIDQLLDIVHQKKIKLVVFFSSSCPHCIDFFQKYRHSSLSKKWGSRIAFIHMGYSLKDKSWTTAFCQITLLGDKCLNSFYQTDSQSALTQTLLGSLGYRGTPHFTILDKKGNAVLPSFPLDIYSTDTESTRDLLVDLQDLLQTL
jgi:protein-disulfide isomerase